MSRRQSHAMFSRTLATAKHMIRNLSGKWPVDDPNPLEDLRAVIRRLRLPDDQTVRAADFLTKCLAACTRADFQSQLRGLLRHLDAPHKPLPQN